MHHRTKSPRLALAPGIILAFTALVAFAAPTFAQSLGSAESFTVLGASTVTNTGATEIIGDVGVSPGSAITGFPPGHITDGALHANDSAASQAHADLATAYTAFAGLPSPPANNLSGTDLGGLTLTPGVYRFDTSATSGGILTLDGQGNPEARFIIQVGTTLITSSSSSVLLINQADARNVYIQTGTSVTLGSGSTFIGNLLAGASVTSVSGTNLIGRLMALTGAVTLDTNQVISPGFTTPTPTPSPGTPPGPAQLLNISTRLNVQPGEKAAIAGFIITGQAPKKVILRGMGPSIAGLSPLLANPMLELHGDDGSVITSNDDWQDTEKTEVEDSTIPPTDDLESAIVATLPAGNYTAILRGQSGTSGIGVVEMYDLAPSSDSLLANISTRGFVQSGNEVMIGGFIFGNGSDNEPVLIRGLGPSLTGVANQLADPILSLYDGNGAVLMSNDNWHDDPAQAALIIATGVPPKDDLEAALLTTLPPGGYTAIVSGNNGSTGIALVEVYHLQ
ncbi:MAG: ice-binding family protein [Chthoniobacterales bacterium]